jgi:uncharacterized protein (UPF0179 family)
MSMKRSMPCKKSQLTRKAIANLPFGQGTKHVKVQEGNEGCMVGPEAVLEVTVVDAHFK